MADSFYTHCCKLEVGPSSRFPLVSGEGFAIPMDLRHWGFCLVMAMIMSIAHILSGSAPHSIYGVLLKPQTVLSALAHSSHTFPGVLRIFLGLDSSAVV